MRSQHLRSAGAPEEAAACGADPWHGMAAATSGVSEIAIDAQASKGVNGPSTHTAARAGARIRIPLLLRTRDCIAWAAYALVSSRIKRKERNAKRLVGVCVGRAPGVRSRKSPLESRTVQLSTRPPRSGIKQHIAEFLKSRRIPRGSAECADRSRSRSSTRGEAMHATARAGEQAR